MADLVIYGSPLSPFVRKAEVVAQTKGLEYDFENVSMPFPDWYVEISPARRMPVLRDKSVGEEGPAGTIADSSAICAFLDRKGSGASLYGESAFDCGRITWLEEYADTELAMPAGMGVFRPLIFTLMQGKEQDIATAKETWATKLSKCFDYLEAQLDGNAFFVGGALSMADIAVGCQLSQLGLVAQQPDKARWPSLVAHLEAMKALPPFAANLATCAKMLGAMKVEKVDLS